METDELPLGKLAVFHDEQSGGKVKFLAKVVTPTGSAMASAASITSAMPLIVYFEGLGSSGGLSEIDVGRLATLTGTPFVVAAPFRSKGMWWVLDDASEWGFLDGDLQVGVVDALLAWILWMSEDRCIDRNWVSLVGISAGAYAVTELVARNRGTVKLRAVVFCGIHGHGQSDLQGVQGKRAHGAKGEAVVQKWHDYIDRLATHTSPPQIMLAAHHPEDAICPWVYAHKILLALSQQRRELGLQSQVDWVVGMNRSRKNKSLHNYQDKVIYRARWLEMLLPSINKRNHDSEEEKWFEPAKMMLTDITTNCNEEQKRPSPDVEIVPSKRARQLDVESCSIQLPSVADALASAPWRKSRQDHPSAQTLQQQPMQQGQSKEIPGPTKPSAQIVQQQPTQQRQSKEIPGPTRPSAQTVQQQPTQQRQSKEIPEPDRPSAQTILEQPRQQRQGKEIPGQTRDNLMCANPHCAYLVHIDAAFGGFCCKKCHWALGRKKPKSQHGRVCAKKEAQADTPRADPVAPANPI